MSEASGMQDVAHNSELLRSEFHLTNAEAAIVAHFLQLPELCAVARERGSSYQTVRNQFKSAMQKTESHSQVELALKAERMLTAAKFSELSAAH